MICRDRRASRRLPRLLFMDVAELWDRILRPRLFGWWE